MVIKAIILVIVELISYWIVGTMAGDVLSRHKKRNMGLCMVQGFLIYEILFQICALPFILLRKSLTQLAFCWNLFFVVFILIGVLWKRERLIKQISELLIQLKTHPLYWLAAFAGVILLCWYTSLNGELNEDADYYIGLVSTTLNSDSMFRRNVYTGQAIPSLYLRRVLVTFEIQAAVLAKTFGVQPIILMRVTKSALNVILTACLTKAIGKLCYRERVAERCEERSIVFMLLALYSNFFMDNTIYTSATFFLHRTFEGKAYAANTLILFVIYICLECMIEKRKENVIWLFLLLWASVAISTSALIVNIAAIAVWLFAYSITVLVGRKRIQAEDSNGGFICKR